MKIGVSGPFSGKRSVYGNLIKESTENVLINNRDKEIEIVYFDDKAEEITAIEASKYFIECNVDAVIGHFNSSCAKAVAPIYHENGIVFFAPASTAIEIPYNKKGFVLRLCPDNEQQIDLLIRVVINSKFKKIGVFMDETPYAKELFNIARRKLVELEIGVNINPNLNSERDIDVIWFFGTHFFCIDKVEEFLRSKINLTDLTKMFCDDCFIDEFLDNKTVLSIDDTYVVKLNLENGYQQIFKEGFEQLIQLLINGQKNNFINEYKWELHQV